MSTINTFLLDFITSLPDSISMETKQQVIDLWNSSKVQGQLTGACKNSNTSTMCAPAAPTTNMAAKVDNYTEQDVNSEIHSTNNHIQTQNSFLSTIDFQDNKRLVTSCIDEIQHQLTEYPAILIYGKECRQNRSIGFFSDTSKGYFYSRQLCKSKPLTDHLKLLLEKVNQRFNSNFNGILVNKYSSGNDYIGKHSDEETGLDPIGVVALSYGAVRKFRIREKSTGKQVMDIPTMPCHIIHMGGDFQKEFTHEIPVEKKVKDTRFSLTFRKHIV